MNINQLRFAVAVASTHSFSQAAKRCFVTQPTLSNAVAQLEEQLGHKLFLRTTRSVSLTPFGEEIVPKFEKLIAESEGILAFAKSWKAEPQSVIRIGLSPVVDMMLLQQLIEPYRTQHQQDEFYCQECYLDDLEDQLKHHQLDIIIMPPREVKSAADRITLYSEPLFYVPTQPTSQDQDFFTLQDASQQKLVLTVDVCGLREATQKLFQNNNLSINEYPGQATSYSVVEDWAKVGIGAGVLPQSKISESNPSARPLKVSAEQSAQITCCAYHLATSDYEPHIQAFIDHLAG